MEKWISRINLTSWILAAAAVAVGLAWRLIWKDNIPPQIPLFYSKPWGDEQLASPSWMWTPIGMTLFIAATTNLVSKSLSKYPVLQTTVAAAALISQIILTSAIIRIIILVM